MILVAGRGTRLGPGITDGGPKCLVPVLHSSILEIQVAALSEVGVREVVLVVGHEVARVREAASRLETRYGVNFSFLENREYATTNTAVSMAKAAEVLRGGAYTLNGDVVFDRALIQALAAAPGEAVVVVDPHPCGAEEVKVHLGAHNRVLAMGKALDPASADGEFIGIARFSSAAGSVFADALMAHADLSEWRMRYYDDLLHEIAASVPMTGLVLHGVPMVEIDFPEDLERAREYLRQRLVVAEKYGPGEQAGLGNG